MNPMEYSIKLTSKFITTIKSPGRDPKRFQSATRALNYIDKLKTDGAEVIKMSHHKIDSFTYTKE